MDNVTNASKELLEYRAQRLTEFKNAFKGMIATSDAAYIKSDKKAEPKRQRVYSKDEIKRIVEEGGAIERAALSQFFFATNGLYKRIIIHYATFLTYSWILVPYLKNRKYEITEKKIAQAYYNASDFCTGFQIERKCSLFAKDILVKGAYYGLLDITNNNIVIQDLPFEYCRSRFKNQDDIDIVEFDLSFFKDIRDDGLREDILKTYPKLI